MHQSVSDRPFPRKKSRSWALPGGRHPNDIRALAQTPDGIVWIGTADGLFAFNDGAFKSDADIPCRDIKRLIVDNGALLACTGLTLSTKSASGTWHSDIEETWDAGAVIDVLPGSPPHVILTEDGPGTVIEGAFSAEGHFYPADANALCFTRHEGVTWVGGDRGLRIIPPNSASIDLLTDHQVRDIAFTQDGDAIVATSSILYRVSPSSYEILALETPVTDFHAVVVTEGWFWSGSSQGLCGWDGNRWHYLAGPRWLPSDDVRALLPIENAIYVGTGNGFAEIRLDPTTLERKAADFDARIRDRHLRLKGYVTSSRLDVPGDLSTSRPVPSDNDGLWTALYLAAHSYRFAVTEEPQARHFADQAFDAIAWLEGVTTVDGFPTKAIISPDEDTGSDPVSWYPSTDGQWLWKGDCSSDEIDGHMYGYSIYYDLAATDEKRAEIRDLVDRIMGHILDNGYLLIGADGKRTRWGVWAPEYLNGPWRAQRGLNSLEILSALRSAEHITGNSRYADAYKDLVENHGYAENARRTKITTPGHVNHSDDELAFISYYPLLKYETDTGLRDIYLNSLTHAWEIERSERNPWWNFIYSALVGTPTDIDESARTLREIPSDLLNWPVRNSHRRDVVIDAHRGRKGEVQATHVLPYDELPMSKWNGNPYGLDASTIGNSEDDGTYYVLPYWMGRYYGYIEPAD
jgi:hypothetical protein